MENLDKLTGEDQLKQRPKYVLPLVRLDGNEGRFYKIVYTDEGVERIDLGTKISGVPLKFRRSYNAFTENQKLFTNEHDSWRDKITLFEVQVTKDGKVKNVMVDEGTIEELREKYPFPVLKMSQIIYFYLLPEKEVVKLIIKGKSLSYLFDYFGEFKQNEHTYQFITQLTAQEEYNERLKKKYYSCSFARKGMVEDLEEITEKIYEVHNKIKEVESYYEGYIPPEEVKPEVKEMVQMTEEESLKSKEQERIDFPSKEKEFPF